MTRPVLVLGNMLHNRTVQIDRCLLPWNHKQFVDIFTMLPAVNEVAIYIVPRLSLCLPVFPSIRLYYACP